MPLRAIDMKAMRNPSKVKRAFRDRRRGRRLRDLARSAARRRELTPAEKLDLADGLIRDAWSLHDAAKGTVVRRRR